MSKPIRIVQFGMSDTLGGVETFIMNLYRNIDRDRVQFDFLLPHTVTNMPFADEATNMGARIYPVLYSQRESIAKAHSSLYDFFDQHDEIAGLHVNATLMTHDRLMKAAARHHVPMRIFHSHNAKFGEQLSVPRKLLTIHARSTVLKSATDLFACSSLAAEYMFHKQDGVRIIPNAIDVQRFAFNRSVRAQVRHELGIDDGTKVVGFAGRFHESKNPLLLLDIFHAVHLQRPDTVLLLCGDGGLRDAMERKCAELNIADSVRFLGIRKDIERIYQAFDLFLLPSTYEGLPIVLVETQCAGLHCVTTEGRVPAEVNITGNVEFVPFAASPETWAKAVISHLDDPRSETASMDVRNHGFDIHTMAQNVQDYYLSHAVEQGNR